MSSRVVRRRVFLVSDSLVCFGFKRKLKRCVSDVVGVRRKCFIFVKVR